MYSLTVGCLFRIRENLINQVLSDPGCLLQLHDKKRVFYTPKVNGNIAINKVQHGISLIEVLVVMAIIGILVSIALPSYQAMVEGNRLKQAAESLANDLKFARIEAIKRSVDVTLAFSGTCYGISTGDIACKCGTAGSCNIKTVDLSQFTGNTISGNNVTYSFMRGTTAATVTSALTSSHYAANVASYTSGRVTVCTTGGVLGYPALC